MGGRASTLTEPWRKTKGWEQSDRKKLVSDCVKSLNVPSFRIVLTGPIGAGKSSVYNSLNSVLRNEVVTTAEVRDHEVKKEESCTKRFHVYEMRDKANHDPLPWKICDTMGLWPYTQLYLYSKLRKNSYIYLGEEHDVANILSAVDGHVPDKYEFNWGEFSQDSFGYISNPAITERAHCIAVVIAADTFPDMGDEMKRKLIALIERRNIPTFIILTKVDLVCKAVKEDVSKVYHSTDVRKLVSDVSKMLNGLPENQIFPVVNYTEQTELDVNMDILFLYAVHQILNSAQVHLETERD